MASVSSNYAEVFVDGGATAAAGSSSSQAIDRVIYSDVQIGGLESASSASSTQQQQRFIASSTQQQHVASSSQQQQEEQHIQLEQSHFTQSGASESQSATSAASEIQAASTSSAMQVSSGGQAASEVQLSERIVGYGYQSFAVEGSTAESQQSAVKKESKFGQFRRSFSKGKKPRLPTGQASNFASGRDVIMKGWLHKQDSGGFHLWKRRWFVLRSNELFYYKSPKDNGALGQIKLTPEHRIVPTDDNLSKRYSFKIEKAGERTYFLAADDKETLTNWMNAVSLSALGIPSETIIQSLQELKPAGTSRKTTSVKSTTSKTTTGSGLTVSGGGSGSSTSGQYRVQPAAQQLNAKQAFSVSNTTAVTNISITDATVNGGSAASAINGASVAVNGNSLAVNGAASAFSGAGSVASAETQIKRTKSLQSCDISEAEEEESDEGSSSEEESEDEESSMASSGMEQVEFNRKKKNNQQHQVPITMVAEANNGDFFQNLMENNVNVTQTRNVNVNENVTVNKNITSDDGLRSFFGSGQHITGSEAHQQVAQQTASAELLTKPLAVKPPAYDTLNKQPRGPVSDVGAAPKVSGRAGQIYGDLAEWQNRTLQKPPSSAQNRGRFASAGDPLATMDRRGGAQTDRSRGKSVDRELDEPGIFQRTQSMRSLKMWYDHQRTTGRSRGGTPEPDGHSPYGGQQPLIMDLDKNDRMYINPSAATLVRSKSRQGQQTLTKSSGALVPVKPAPRPATAMGVHGQYGTVATRDQIMMQKNYQMQLYLRQQYLAQQQQQQQQQNSLLMQQQMQQQQALFLQQQIKKEEEMLRKKKEKEKKEKEKRILKQKREQELIEEQLKRSTTIINESVVNQGDPMVKRVFVRRAKKEPKPPPPPPSPPPTKMKEFSCQTITDTGIQTEVNDTAKPPIPPPQPPTFSETLIVNQTTVQQPIRFVETVTISPPTPVESEEESEEEWEVLVSSDQNSWNMVAKETLPSRVIRSASLSNLEFFIRDELSAETQKVLDEAEEVRFSEEVIQTILTKTVEDTTTTNTTKTISMTTETNNNTTVTDGDFTIQDVEEGEIVLPGSVINGHSGTLMTNDDAAAHARTTTVTNISTDPYQDTQVSSYATEDGEGKLMTTSFQQGHATIVDDRVAYDYGSSQEAQTEFQRQLLQMQEEFGQAGDVTSDSGMSYQTPAGHHVDVQQRISTVKSGVQVTLGDGSQQIYQQDQQQSIQAPEISITDMETNQVLPPQAQSDAESGSESVLQVNEGDFGGVDVSLGDFRIATIKRRVSTVADTPQPRLTPERDTQTKTVKGILKKTRPSSSSSDVSGSHQFTEQFLETVQKVAEDQFAEVQSQSTHSSSAIDASQSQSKKSSTIVVQANSPSPRRKDQATSESSSVDISIASPATKHFSTHLHKTISSSSSPTLMVEVDPSANGQKPTTILTTTLDFDQGHDSSVKQTQSATVSSLTQENIAVTGNQVFHDSSHATRSGHSSKSASLSPASSGVQLEASHQQQSSNNAEITEKMSLLMQSQSASTGSRSETSLAGAVLPPLEQDIEKLREKVVQSVSHRRETTENAGALGRKLIALKRETEAKETTMTYFTRRLKEEEGALEIIRKTEAEAGSVPYIEERRKTQESNVTQLREKISGLQLSIQEGKDKIESLEAEWKKVKPDGDLDLMSSLSRSASSSRAELRGGVSTENLGGGSVSGSDLSTGAVGAGGAAAATSAESGGSGNFQVTSVSSSSSKMDSMESKAVAVEKEAMRSVLSTITSQFTARNQDFDRLRREEEEIKALLASRMRGIDLEIDQIEAEQQRMEIQQALGGLETAEGQVVVENTQQVDDTT